MVNAFLRDGRSPRRCSDSHSDVTFSQCLHQIGRSLALFDFRTEAIQVALPHVPEVVSIRKSTETNVSFENAFDDNDLTMEKKALGPTLMGAIVHCEKIHLSQLPSALGHRK